MECRAASRQYSAAVSSQGGDAGCATPEPSALSVCRFNFARKTRNGLNVSRRVWWYTRKEDPVSLLSIMLKLLRRLRFSQEEIKKDTCSWILWFGTRRAPPYSDHQQAQSSCPFAAVRQTREARGGSRSPRATTARWSDVGRRRF